MATVKIEVTDQRREDMLVVALEGGSNYWYFLGDDATKIIIDNNPDKTQPISIRMWEAIKNSKSIPIRDTEDENEILGHINLQSIEEGEQIMADKYPTHFMDMINENDDATTADIWFQLCVLKEIVYG